MFKHALLLLPICLIMIATLHAEDRAQAELRFAPAGNAERHAGVWVDGYYIGYVNEFEDKRVLLLPGMHEIVARQAWYEDYVEHVMLEPGSVYNMKLSMVKEERMPSAGPTAEVKISATPARAAVFVDEQFAGHSDEFDGPGQAMLVMPGQHKLSIALPGYQPFEVTLNVRPHQKLKITTKLQKGSISQAGPLVSPE